MLGVAMGYDSERPAWPEPFAGEWARLEEETPGLGRPPRGVRGALAGRTSRRRRTTTSVSSACTRRRRARGAGKALLEAFCRRSAADPLSAGVYLDTANPSSLEFYLRNGFVAARRGRPRGHAALVRLSFGRGRIPRRAASREPRSHAWLIRPRRLRCRPAPERCRRSSSSSWSSTS